MPRVNRFGALGAIAFLMTACTDNRDAAVPQVQVCADREWGAKGGELPDSAVAVDLDCDGQQEQLTVTWGRQDSISIPILTIQSSTLGGEVGLPVEGLPTISAVGDLDGDSIADIVLSVSDESTVYTTVVVATPSGPLNAVRDTLVEWPALQFRLDDEAPSSCREKAKPRVERSSSGRWILVIPFGASWEGDCETLPQARLAIVEGLLTRVQ